MGAAALKLRQKHFVVDGETVVLDKDGVSNFDALASRKHDKRAQFYAFDMLAGDGDDYRGLPLSIRKRNLARLLRSGVDGIFPAEYDAGEMAYDLFGAACHLGLEGIVSKRRY
jgi:bifunctional non-homologous end joining protein LigD